MLNAPLKMSIEEHELIVSARAGDQNAFHQLYQRYQKTIKSYVYTINIPSCERDDLIQEGLIGLTKAIRSYDHSSSSFTTYASLCIKRSIVSALRKYNRNSRVVLSDDPAAISESADFAPSPEMNIVESENIKQRYNSFLSTLSKFEQKTFELYITGITYNEMASRLKCSEKSVDNAVTRIKRKLRSVKN